MTSRDAIRDLHWVRSSGVGGSDALQLCHAFIDNTQNSFHFTFVYSSRAPGHRHSWEWLVPCSVCTHHCSHHSFFYSARTDYRTCKWMCSTICMGLGTISEGTLGICRGRSSVVEYLIPVLLLMPLPNCRQTVSRLWLQTYCRQTRPLADC